MNPFSSNRFLLIGISIVVTMLMVACGSDDSGGRVEGSGASGPSDATVSATSPTAVSSTQENSSGETVSLTGDAEIGQRLFRSEGCSACHSTDKNRIVGPGLAGISSRGDDAYIRQSLSEPGAVVVEGYPNVMPRFSGLSEETVNHLVAYLKTLN